ncbi:MAG: ATP-binding cassette domain-containing protein [Blautia sp.]|nr:ATP-binding cassette domain-containing protein [Blautia sp.]
MADLSIRDVSFSYGETQILKDVSLHLKDQELVSLLGESGGGKTTLFHVIAGVLRPDRGQVLLNGQDITGESGHVSYMLQKDLLLPYRTIIDNVCLPLLLAGMKKKEARAKAAPNFADFGLAGTELQYPHQLSGGMRQRAALLRTYMFSLSREGSPVAALLDEPFSALDTLTRQEMHRWYLGMMEKIRLSTLFITHDIDEAILLSDRICLLTGRPGTISEEIVIERPKSKRDGFAVTEEFLEYKKRILKGLKRT